MSGILVTKATGTTGRHVVTGLAKRAVTVKAGSRNPSFAAQENIVPLAFDWENRSTWAPALDGTDVV